ncbi:MAG: hypothetical protein GY950_14230 [bacterium]|nr:hypothetical protein [bacterium]
MKKIIIVALLFVCCLVFTAAAAFAEEGFEGRSLTNNIMVPTGFTLNKGEFIVGLGHIGFGISDNVQVGTNILLMLLQDYNANLKISFLANDKHAFAAGLKVHKFDLDVSENETGFSSISPFAVYTTKVSKNTAVHLGGQYSHFSGDKEISEATAIATSAGSSVYMGVEHSFSNKTKFLAETGYDMTFKGFRVGGAVVFGWKTFRLKLGGNYFKPKDTNGFIFPTISLWWRFNG